MSGYLKQDLGLTTKQIGDNLLYANFSYETDIKEIEKLQKGFPKDCELFLYSDHLDDTKESEYRCAIVIDSKNKTVYFANAGSRFGFNIQGFYYIVDDIRLATGHLPKKLNSASKLNDLILDNIQALGGELKDWKFDYSGHSLGGVMCNISAADMAIKLKAKECLSNGQISSVGFDNPGSKKLVEKMYKKANLDVSQAEKDVNYVNFNNSKNLVNTINKQIGQTYELSQEGSKEPNAFSQFIGYISKKLSFLLSPIVKKICEVISYGRISEQAQGHSLTNFVDVIHNKNGKIKTPEGVFTDVESAIKKDYIIPYDSNVVSYVKDKIRLNKKTNAKEMDLIMISPDGDKFLTSKNEMHRALDSRSALPTSDKMKEIKEKLSIKSVRSI